MMYVIKKMFLIGMMMLQADMVLAADCQDVPTCASLGFSMSVQKCLGTPVLRCPFDRANDEAVWCHKGVSGLRCMSGNYFNDQTGKCFPKSISDYVFIDDELDVKAIVLQLSATSVLRGMTYGEFTTAGKEKDVVPLRNFHKIEEYVFKSFGTGCYVVADDSTDNGAVVYLGNGRIAVKLDETSFQKYCFSSSEGGEDTAKASVLKYRVLDYRWK